MDKKILAYTDGQLSLSSKNLPKTAGIVAKAFTQLGNLFKSKTTLAIEKAMQEDLEITQALNNKISFIKQSLGGADGEKRASQFQKAWEELESQKTLLKPENLLEINYVRGEEGIVGITGIPGLDRKGYSYECEYATKEHVQKRLGGFGKELFVDGKGVEKGRDRENMIAQNLMDVDFFDREESGLGANNLIFEEIASYLPTLKEKMKIEKKWYTVLHILLDGEVEDYFNTFKPTWLADKVVGYNSYYKFPMRYTGNKYEDQTMTDAKISMPIRGYQKII